MTTEVTAAPREILYWFNPTRATIADVSDVQKYHSTHFGQEVRSVHVSIKGKVIFTAGGKHDCEDYLIRTGYFPRHDNRRFWDEMRYAA